MRLPRRDTWDLLEEKTAFLFAMKNIAIAKNCLRISAGLVVQEGFLSRPKFYVFFVGVCAGRFQAASAHVIHAAIVRTARLPISCALQKAASSLP